MQGREMALELGKWEAWAGGGVRGAEAGPFFSFGRTFLLTLEQSDIWVPNSLACPPCSQQPLLSLEYRQTDTVQGNPARQILLGDTPHLLPGILGDPSCSFSVQGPLRGPFPCSLLPGRKALCRAVLCYRLPIWLETPTCSPAGLQSTAAPPHPHLYTGPPPKADVPKGCPPSRSGRSEQCEPPAPALHAPLSP